jgi:hypothetical protein
LTCHKQVLAMSSIFPTLMLIPKAIRAFFKADVQLRRGQRGLEVVLADPAAVQAGESPVAAKRKGKRVPDPAREREQLELQQIRASLARLLDELPDNRSTLRHLAFIEHALEKKGLRALHKVPFDVLKRALDQFEGLVVNWSDSGLATLRSKMAVTLIEREPEAALPPTAVAAPVASAIESDDLVHPVALEGDDAAEAEAALLAAYGSVVMPGLELVPTDDEPSLELQGELSSPSGKALARAVRRGDEIQPAATRPGSLREASV